ncbi:nitrate reductase molybdenum cofactor assembly chaperone [Salinisphaera sp. LB1]|uniref:nitrate reductase molybdenum cofactor assembly chaperone n=1 Tax=Salinisphaera sp. LB1 TaxID=2183911 RepID=UPI000D706684|nr:nitrate reductase molybdenum cofactor assembly chaperone [Salinisphaera sp. LB1]AWN14226.1 Respiratory nitrate reductase delta chain [Salinisphaera sp. LB1]
MSTDPQHRLARPLQALARLLDYPDATLQQHVDELAGILAATNELSEAEREAIVAFVTGLGAMDIYDAQSRYVETFDRGRKVSLYVFEHVYGESRDRGPAMIELKQAYSEHGLETDTRELPDFLPVLLEFCAQIPEESARTWLAETTHVLQRVSVRLAERDNGYASVFTVLLRLIGADPAPENLTDMAGKEKRDDTPAAIDQVWAEAPVTFGPGESHTNDGATRQEPAEFSDKMAAKNRL